MLLISNQLISHWQHLCVSALGFAPCCLSQLPITSMNMPTFFLFPSFCCCFQFKISSRAAFSNAPTAQQHQPHINMSPCACVTVYLFRDLYVARFVCFVATYICCLFDLLPSMPVLLCITEHHQLLL